MERQFLFAIRSLSLSIALLVLSSCQKGPSRFENKTINKQIINQLESRLEKLELQLGKKPSSPNRTPDNTPEGPIESMTFRFGTKDDRLRIYWADGSKSELPCEKEHNNLWACG